MPLPSYCSPARGLAVGSAELRWATALRPRRTVLAPLLLLPFTAVGCLGGDERVEEAIETGAQSPGCTPGAPGCDILDSPCVHYEEEPGERSEVGPTTQGLTTQGLTDSLTAKAEYPVWPEGRVPYKIEASIGATTKPRLLAAMQEWQTKTAQRVRFEEALPTDTAYVRITEGSTLVSPFVGYRAGRVVTLHLRNPENITVIRHEIGHVLGFHHEHKRLDRNGYIQVVNANIVDTQHCRYQFSACSYCTPVGDYDPKSVMHYRTSDLSNCRTGPVLLNLDGTRISHYWAISPGDVKGIEIMYGPPPGDGGVEDAGVEDARVEEAGVEGAGTEDVSADDGSAPHAGGGESTRDGDPATSAGGCSVPGSTPSGAWRAAIALAALAFRFRRQRG